MIRNKLACVLLCVLGLHGIQVQAFLNITEKAIIFSRNITEQAQQVCVYRRTEDLENQLRKLSRTLNHFYKKIEHYRWFLGLLSDFHISRKPPFNRKEIAYTYYDVFCNQIRLRDSSLDMDYSVWKHYFKSNFQRVKKFMIENDFNLVSVKTYNDFLNQYHSILTEPDPESGLTLIDVLTSSEEARRCKETQSQQMLLFNLIREVSGIEVRTFAFVQFSLAVLKTYQEAIHLVQDEDDIKSIRDMTVFWTDKDIIKKMKQRESDLISRNTKTYNLFKSQSRSLDRLVRKCSDETKIEKLTPIFQKYIINEVDMDEKDSCQNTCPDFKEAKARGCYDQGICAHQRWCNGTLWDCGNNIESPMLICAKLWKIDRYQYVQVDGNTYGKKIVWCDKKVEAKNWARGLVECTYCMCTCENAFTQKHHSFSLRPVESDINSNLLITSFQLKKVKGIFHIQIEQSKLLPNGMIRHRERKRKDDVTVSDSDVEGKDYHTISWKKRAVKLGMISGPPGFVLTGLQLALQDNHILKLMIRVTKFNYKKGKLYAKQSQWLADNVKLQDSINLDLQNLQEYFDGKLKKDANYYFQFTTSALETDVGQSTIPMIETDLVGEKDSPLSGAGLYLRNINGNIVLALQAETYDYSPHL